MYLYQQFITVRPSGRDGSTDCMIRSQVLQAGLTVPSWTYIYIGPWFHLTLLGPSGLVKAGRSTAEDPPNQHCTVAAVILFIDTVN